VAELTKVSVKPLELGLEPGSYRITLQQGDNFYTANARLTADSRVSLTFADFRRAAAVSGNRSRGTGAAEEEDVPVHVLNFQLIPGGGERATNIILLSPFVARAHNIQGIGIAGIALINSGRVQGVQASGLFNLTNGLQGLQGASMFNIVDGNAAGAQIAGVFNYARNSLTGVQGAGTFNFTGGSFKGVQGAGMFNIVDGNAAGVQAASIFNYAKSGLTGIQGAGIFNYAGGSYKGVQAGLVNIVKDGHGLQAGIVNISGSETVVPLGLVNIIKGGLLHTAVFYDDMGFLNLSFRSGSKYVYTLLSAGVQPKTHYDPNALLLSRAGLGVEFPLGNYFIDVDITGGSMVNFKYGEGFGTMSSLAQLRFTAGYKIFEHLGIFGGVSYDYIHRWESASPDPETFNSFTAGWSDGRNTHKLGFFGGIQF
jgi:hypothetical protein